MANMSYCRFQNTLGDLRACLDAMMEAVDDEDNDEDVCTACGKQGAVGTPCADCGAKMVGHANLVLSGEEVRARKSLIETCVEILSFAHENDLLPRNTRIDAADGIGATIDDE